MIKDKSTIELAKKYELVSECIEDIIEVFECNLTEINIRSVCIFNSIQTKTLG